MGISLLSDIIKLYVQVLIQKNWDHFTVYKDF